jgi:hypothetical protein
VQSAKWFHGGRELFHRRAADEIFGEKFKQFQIDAGAPRQNRKQRSKVNSRSGDLGV